MPAGAKKEVSGGDVDDDDDSENDSDYCPDEDKGAHSDNEVPEKEVKLSAISTGRKRKVDDLWASMQAESNSLGTKKSTAIISSSSKPLQKKSSSKKNADILAAIFGKKQSRKICSGVSVKTADSTNETIIRDAARESVKMLQKKTTVTEIRKFAGQEIVIERTVKGKGIADGTSQQSFNTSKASALDSVLDTMKGPKVVSTVAKSGMDWDVYKEKEGLEDELSAATKDGFLTRKDFLQRCDYRAYEQERDERLLKSSSASSSK